MMHFQNNDIRKAIRGHQKMHEYERICVVRLLSGSKSHRLMPPLTAGAAG